MNESASVVRRSHKLGGKIWTSLLLFGFMGQMAWMVENVRKGDFMCLRTTAGRESHPQWNPQWSVLLPAGESGRLLRKSSRQMKSPFLSIAPWDMKSMPWMTDTII